MENLRKLQLNLLKMLIKLDKILTENNIEYFLIGGSALGAVRHEGFIPWDDDIDIGVLREDFEKMERILSESKLLGMKYCKIGNNIIPNAPIGYLYDISDKNLDIKDVPTIDIFPIDGVPENRFLRKIQKYTSLAYHLSISQSVANNRGKKIKIISKVILKITPKFMFKLYQKILKKIIVNWDIKEVKNCVNIFGQAKYDKEIMPKRYMGKPKYIKFESRRFPVPELTHEYLKHLYGDYMKLPEEKDRKPKHKNL